MVLSKVIAAVAMCGLASGTNLEPSLRRLGEGAGCYFFPSWKAESCDDTCILDMDIVQDQCMGDGKDSPPPVWLDSREICVEAAVVLGICSEKQVPTEDAVVPGGGQQPSEDTVVPGGGELPSEDVVAPGGGGCYTFPSWYEMECKNMCILDPSLNMKQCADAVGTDWSTLQPVWMESIQECYDMVMKEKLCMKAAANPDLPDDADGMGCYSHDAWWKGNCSDPSLCKFEPGYKSESLCLASHDYSKPPATWAKSEADCRAKARGSLCTN